MLFRDEVTQQRLKKNYIVLISLARVMLFRVQGRMLGGRERTRLNLSCESNAFQGLGALNAPSTSSPVLISLARVMLFRERKTKGSVSHYGC